MVRFVLFVGCIVYSLRLQAQSSRDIELIRNGDFERKNIGFSSEYRYDPTGSPGSYVITNNAPFVNHDFANPQFGDHTDGTGNFLVCNADGSKGKKIWCGKVKVVPNARYEFTAYFCNVYRKLPPKTSFAFEGGDV